MGDCHTIHYTMGNSHHKKNFSPWETPTFFSLPPMGNSHHFFLSTPLWEIPKKNLEKNFLRDIWTTVPPKMGVSPGERGHGGIPTPPMGYMGGAIAYQDCLSRLLVKIACQDCLFGCLFGYYLFSVLLISFILAVSDAILLFIFATFLLWRYLL